MAYSASFPIPQNMQDTIDNCTVGLGAVGIVGGIIGPGADLIVIAPTWVGMVVALAEQAGEAMDEATAQKICLAAATGGAAFLAGAKIAATIGAWILAIPSGGASVAVWAVGNAALNAKFTDAFGKATARYFLQTESVEASDIVVQILLALVGLQFGIPTGRHDIVA